MVARSSRGSSGLLFHQAPAPSYVTGCQEPNKMYWLGYPSSSRHTMSLMAWRWMRISGLAISDVTGCQEIDSIPARAVLGEKAEDPKPHSPSTVSVHHRQSLSLVAKSARDTPGSTPPLATMIVRSLMAWHEENRSKLLVSTNWETCWPEPYTTQSPHFAS